MCSSDVKVSLFGLYCTPLYTLQIWWNFHKYSLKILTVAYNDVMRKLLRIPRYYTASQMFLNMQVPTCQTVIPNLTYKFICWLEKSHKDIIKVLIDPLVSDTRYKVHLSNMETLAQATICTLL